MPQQIRTSSLIEQGHRYEAMRWRTLQTRMMLDVDPAPADGSLRLPPPSPEVAVEPEPAPWSSTAVGQCSCLKSETGLSLVPPRLKRRWAPRQCRRSELETTHGVSTEPAARVVQSETKDPDALHSGAWRGVRLRGAPVVDGTKQVVLTFNAACWVDVRDSERSSSFRRDAERRAQVLAGQPPYKLVIGNAQAVSITVDGKPLTSSTCQRVTLRGLLSTPDWRP